MNHIKQFFREKGLYLFCLAMVFAATAAGILALRTVVSNVADLTRTRKEALQNDSAWTQPDTAIDKPAQDVPKPTTTPAATEKPSPPLRLLQHRPRRPLQRRRHRPSPNPVSGTRSRWRRSAAMNWSTVRP